MEAGKEAGFDFTAEEYEQAAQEISLVLDPDHQVPKDIEKLQATGPSAANCTCTGVPGLRLVPVVRGDPHRWRSCGSGGRGGRDFQGHVFSDQREHLRGVCRAGCLREDTDEEPDGAALLNGAAPSSAFWEAKPMRGK